MAKIPQQINNNIGGGNLFKNDKNAIVDKERQIAINDNVMYHFYKIYKF